MKRWGTTITDRKEGWVTGRHSCLLQVVRQRILSWGLPPHPLRHPLLLDAASSLRWLFCAGA
eukprot:59379-Pelagomonas_calceolata.AAC.1